MTISDTIYALSTPYGKSGIAVIKISGPQSLKVLKSLKFKKNIIPRKAILGSIYKKYSSIMIDEIIVIYFPRNNSYTGQDIIELQVHGGIAIINSILDELSALKYLRIANNGEFTRIALENNKISLSKAESLIELINAETEYQRKIAVRNYSGDLDNKYLLWKDAIINLLANVEAYIDFPDDLFSDNELLSLNQRIKQLEKAGKK